MRPARHPRWPDPPTGTWSGHWTPLFLVHDLGQHGHVPPWRGAAEKARLLEGKCQTEAEAREERRRQWLLPRPPREGRQGPGLPRGVPISNLVLLN